MNLRLKRYKRAIDAIEIIEKGHTPKAIFDHLKLYTSQIGGTSLIIGQVVNPILAERSIETFGMHDWPEEFAKHWIENDLILQDPVTRHAMRARGLFDWSEAHELNPVSGNRVIDAAQDYGMDKGIAIPITVGVMPMGLVSVGYNDAIDSDDLKHLELVASHAYVSLLNLVQKGKSDSFLPSVRLSPREIDVLSFTAIGKSAWEISKIYSISESTVKKHLSSINVKLGTANKAHAVAKALQGGHILL